MGEHIMEKELVIDNVNFERLSVEETYGVTLIGSFTKEEFKKLINSSNNQEIKVIIGDD